MSRLAAVVGTDSEKVLEGMLKKLEHRGFKHQLIYDNHKYRLGELNVTEDKEVQTGDPHYGVIYDGSPMYNGRETTRAEILNLYKEQGPNFIENISGNFAMVISNGTEFFAARDPYGIKPLYFSANSEHFLLASEIKSLNQVTDDIEIFPPGHYCTGAKELKRYTKISLPRAAEAYTLEEAAKALYELLISAVNRVSGKKHLGSFLSGGLDSSVIAYAAIKTGPGNIPTMAVGLENSDDILKARKVAKYLGTDHYEQVYTPEEMLDVLPQVIYNLESFDVELVNSSIANYYAAKLAQELGLKTVLSGEGADELFAGYHYLKEYETGYVLNEEMVELLRGMHNGGLQRVDRMTQAHSLECVMPFLDPRVVEFALALPGSYKLSKSGVEKWVLRIAFESELPGDILWRTKAQFGIGTGNEEFISNLIEKKVSRDEYARAKKTNNIEFKSKEEYYYYKIFKEFFPARSVEETVNRWLV